jgi:hypothetical protein
VVERAAGRDDGGMPDQGPGPDETTVWMVLLRRGDLAERKGTLRLEDDAVVFADTTAQHERRIRYEEVRRARRVRGSPILILAHEDDGSTVETAFYFTQPPPLRPPEPGEPPSPAAIGGRRPLGPFSAIRRTSKRRHMRENVRYLTTQSGSKKPQIDAWVSEIAERTRG